MTRRLLLFLALLQLAPAAWGGTDEDRLRDALHREVVEGDLTGAIAAYGELLEPSLPAEIRAVAHQRRGVCFELLGWIPKARTAYAEAARLKVKGVSEAARKAHLRLTLRHPPAGDPILDFLTEWWKRQPGTEEMQRVLKALDRLPLREEVRIAWRRRLESRLHPAPRIRLSDGRIHLEARRADRRQLLLAVAETSHLALLIHPAVSGRITCTVRGLEPDGVLEKLLPDDFRLIRFGPIRCVVPRTHPPTPPNRRPGTLLWPIPSVSEPLGPLLRRAAGMTKQSVLLRADPTGRRLSGRLRGVPYRTALTALVWLSGRNLLSMGDLDVVLPPGSEDEAAIWVTEHAEPLGPQQLRLLQKRLNPSGTVHIPGSDRRRLVLSGSRNLLAAILSELPGADLAHPPRTGPRITFSGTVDGQRLGAILASQAHRNVRWIGSPPRTDVHLTLTDLPLRRFLAALTMVVPIWWEVDGDVIRLHADDPKEPLGPTWFYPERGRLDPESPLFQVLEARAREAGGTLTAEAGGRCRLTGSPRFRAEWNRLLAAIDRLVAPTEPVIATVRVRPSGRLDIDFRSVPLDRAATLLSQSGHGTIRLRPPGRERVTCSLTNATWKEALREVADRCGRTVTGDGEEFLLLSPERNSADPVDKKR